MLKIIHDREHAAIHIAIDIDDTITHAPLFFSALTHGLADATISVLTFRADEESAVATLREHDIRWDRLVLSSDPEIGCREGQSLAQWKAETVAALEVDVFFDDMPEVVHLVEPPTKVFMCCDDLMRGWLRQSLKKRT